MRYLTCFDITDDKRRNKLVKLLLKYGNRCQYSVFELDMDIATTKLFEREVNNFKLGEEDKLYIYPIPAEQDNKILRLGRYVSIEDVFVFT